MSELNRHSDRTPGRSGYSKWGIGSSGASGRRTGAGQRMHTLGRPVIVVTPEGQEPMRQVMRTRYCLPAGMICPSQMTRSPLRINFRSGKRLRIHRVWSWMLRGPSNIGGSVKLVRSRGTRATRRLGGNGCRNQYLRCLITVRSLARLHGIPQTFTIPYQGVPGRVLAEQFSEDFLGFARADAGYC